MRKLLVSLTDRVSDDHGLHAPVLKENKNRQVQSVKTPSEPVETKQEELIVIHKKKLKLRNTDKRQILIRLKWTLDSDLIFCCCGGLFNN